MIDKAPLVIILEDEPAHAEALRRSLCDQEIVYRVETASTLRSFHDKIVTEIPYLVIADLNLPDGKAINFLTGSLETMQFPLLIMTAFGDEEMAVYAIKNGAMDYVVKSDTIFKEIPRIINRMLREWENIQKRKAVERSLRESEEKFRKMFENSLEGILFSTPDGNIFDANPAASRILGYTKEQICKIGRDGIIDTSDPKLMMALKDRDKTGKFIGELNFINSEGKILPAEISSAIYYSENGEIFSCIFIKDITHRKKLEEQMIQNIKELDTLFSALPDLYFKLGKDGTIFDFRAGDTSDLYLSPEKFLGKRLSEILPLDVAKQFEDSINRVIENHELVIIEYELSIRNHLKNFEARFLPLEEDKIIAVVRNITPLKQKEEIIRNQNSLLSGILESSYNPILSLDRNYCYTSFNKSHANAMKILYNVDIEIGKSFLNYQPVQRDRESAKHSIDFALNGQPYITEEFAGDSQQSISFFQISHNPIFNENREVIGAAIYAQDLTERKKIEILQKESEEKYRLLFRNLSLGFALHEIILDKNGKPYDYKFIEVNSEFENLTGFASDKLIGKTVLKVMPDTELFWIATYGKVALTGESIQFEQYSNVLNKFYNVSAYSPKHGFFATLFSDITERKLHERVLIESENKLKTIFEVLPVGISILDKNENDVLTNSALEKILKVNKDGLKTGSYKNRRYFSPDGKILLKNEYASVRALYDGKSIFNEEVGIEIEDGNIIWTSVSAVPVSFPDWAAVVVNVDITERKKAENELRVKKEELDNYFLSSLDLLCIADTKGYFLRLNPEWENALGYNLKDIEKKRMFDFIHPDDLESTKESVMDLSRGKELLSFTNRYKHQNGTYRWIEWRSRADAEIIYATARDITDRVHIEQALIDSKKQYQDLIEYLPIGIAVHTNGRVVFSNLTGVKILKADNIEKMIGLNLFDMVPNEYLETIRTRIAKTLKEGKIAEITEEKFIRFDGKTIDVEVMGLPILFAGEPSVLTIFNDITDKKISLAQQKRMEDEIHQSQKMEAVGRLAGGVAHDLNNLLSPILGYTEVLLEDYDKDFEMKNSLEKIFNAGTRARDLVKQLLAFSRKQTLEFTNIDINKTISEFEKLLRRMIREDVEIKIRYNKDLPLIRGDKGQIEQVVMNLSINAQDAMPNGGVLSIETGFINFEPKDDIKGDFLKFGEYVILSISDNGFGMDKETCEQIFEPFFTTKEIGKGTGLGLATVYGIIRQHDGDVSVYSEPGLGTTFKIYLPVTKIDFSPENVDLKLKKDISGNETIFVVEDNKMVRELAVDILKKLGYSVFHAPDAKECFEIIKTCNKKIDLLLTDVVMPDMNGKELYQNILLRFPEIKVLYMSGYTRDVIAHRGVLDEGIHFIQKPFSKHGLGQKVREVLDLK